MEKQEKIQTIITSIFEVIKGLPDGTETSIDQLLKKVCPSEKFSDEDLFYINEEIHKKAKLENIILDESKYANQCVGLPFNIPFVKESSNSQNN